MNPGTFKARHASAMLVPQGPDETTLVVLFTELSRLADRYKDDTVMIGVVELIGEALTLLAADGNTGRIDTSMYLAKVRDVVARAGGNLA